MLRLCRDYSRVDFEKVTFYYNRKNGCGDLVAGNGGSR